MERTVLTVDEVARLLGISKPKAYELTKETGFPVVRIGKRTIIPFEQFMRWLDAKSKEH